MPSMLIELRVEMEDGTTHDVVADQRDIAKWEIQDFGCPFSDISSRIMLALRWLAWSALSRRGRLPEVDGKPMTWEQFDAVCVEASDMPAKDDGGEGLDPGQPAPSEKA